MMIELNVDQVKVEKDLLFLVKAKRVRCIEVRNDGEPCKVTTCVLMVIEIKKQGLVNSRA